MSALARIPNDKLIPDGEPAESESWVRSPLYEGKSHFLYDGVNALCGRSIPTYANDFVQWATTLNGKEWYRAYETRDSGSCSPCKTYKKADKHRSLRPASTKVVSTPSVAQARREANTTPTMRRAAELQWRRTRQMLESILGEVTVLDG